MSFTLILFENTHLLANSLLTFSILLPQHINSASYYLLFLLLLVSATNAKQMFRRPYHLRKSLKLQTNMEDVKELCPIHKKQEVAIIFMLFVPYWKEVNLCIEKFFTLAQLQCTLSYFREKNRVVLRAVTT